jgi:hypothetical protein
MQGSKVLHELIRSGNTKCTPVCRHGWPDIYHAPNCPWSLIVEQIYDIERYTDDLEKEKEEWI